MKPRCPTCHSDYPLLLGRMGRLIWFRCRYCGLDFHRQALAGESYYDSVSEDQAEHLAQIEGGDYAPL